MNAHIKPFLLKLRSLAEATLLVLILIPWVAFAITMVAAAAMDPVIDSIMSFCFGIPRAFLEPADARAVNTATGSVSRRIASASIPLLIFALLLSGCTQDLS